MRGTGRNRTGVRGFAGRCLATRPRCRTSYTLLPESDFTLPAWLSGNTHPEAGYRCSRRDAGFSPVTASRTAEERNLAAVLHVRSDLYGSDFA